MSGEKGIFSFIYISKPHAASIESLLCGCISISNVQFNCPSKTPLRLATLQYVYTKYAHISSNTH